VLVVLLLAYILSFIDRNVLAMLVGPIRQEFAISDFQFSILHGWAFTLFYIFLGLPIGWLADRYSRKWIITSGVFFWSIMTVACGLAKNFGSLFVTRIGVGVGEAALSPPSYSLLSDYFPPNKLRWATAIFATGITIGSGTSYIVGGQVYEYFAGIDELMLPLLGQFSAWQATFVAVGLPGLLVVLLLLFAKEPPRRRTHAQDGAKEVPISEVFGFLK
jgi:MFS family permease